MGSDSYDFKIFCESVNVNQILVCLHIKEIVVRQSMRLNTNIKFPQVMVPQEEAQYQSNTQKIALATMIVKLQRCLRDVISIVAPSNISASITEPGERICLDDFVIVKPISRGGYGRVYLARKRAGNGSFAIKVRF